MEQALAVRCTAQTIDTALTQINGDITPVADTLRAHDKTAAFNQEVTAIWEVRHLIELAEVMLHASESRQESRGSMQRLDFPERDDEHFLAHSMVADDGSVSFKPVHITDYPPRSASTDPLVVIPKPPRACGTIGWLILDLTSHCFMEAEHG